MNRLDLLDDLQAVDLRLEENARARREAEARLADNSSVRAAQSALESESQRLNQSRARQRALELEVSGIEDKIKSADARLYGGRVTNPKELRGLEQDEQMLKRHKSEVEDRLIEAMSEVESNEGNLQARRLGFAKISAEHEAAALRDREALHALEAEAVQLKRTRDEIRARLRDGDLNVYESLRREKKGRAVAHINGHACAGCGSEVPSGLLSRARVGEELVFCSNCGRILIP